MFLCHIFIYLKFICRWNHILHSKIFVSKSNNDFQIPSLKPVTLSWRCWESVITGVCVEWSCFQYLMHKHLKWLKLLEMDMPAINHHLLFLLQNRNEYESNISFKDSVLKYKRKKWTDFKLKLILFLSFIQSYLNFWPFLLAWKDCQHFWINFG